MNTHSQKEKEKNYLKRWLSKHDELENANVENVWNVDLSNTYTPKNIHYLSEIEELQRFRKSMLNGNMKFNSNMIKQIEAQLKKESNKAMTFFNKPPARKTRARKTRRNTTRRRRR